MSEINITKEEFLQLITAEGPQCQVTYNKCRGKFVEFLKKQQLDWKIGKRKKRSALLHQALVIACHEGLESEAKPLDYLQNIGKRLYADRYPDKEIDRHGMIVLPPIATDGYIMEATQLEERMTALNDQQREVLTQLLVAQLPIETVAAQQGSSIRAIETTFKEGICVVAAEPDLEEQDIESIKVVRVEGKNALRSSNNKMKKSLEPINKGFLGLSAERLEEKLQRCEQIRLDERKLKVLEGNNVIQHREIYWAARKKMALGLTETSDCSIAEALKITPKVWENFLSDFQNGKIKLPLEAPIQDSLQENCKRFYENSSIDRGLKSESLVAWDKLIAKEEEILDRVKSRDERYLSQLVKDLEPEFSSILRKVFKLYDAGLQNRPAEIYYRSFAEVVYKVEKEELAKPLTSTFRTYLIGVGSNVYRQEYFKQGDNFADINEEITEGVVEATTIEDKFQAEENAAMVSRFLKTIGDPCKSLIELRYLKGFSYQVISERVGKKEGALRTQLSRCMEKMRRLVAS